MGKIFLVNAIHNYAISKAEIRQWQEHTVPLTSLVFVLVSWSQFPERCFTFERQPAQEWAIKKRLKLWFFYTYPLCFPGWKHARPFAMVCKVRTEITPGRPPVPSCPYLHSNPLLTHFEGMSLTLLMGMNVFHSVTGTLWQKEWDGHTSAGGVFVATQSHTHSVAGPALQLGLRQVKEKKVQSILKLGK